MASITWTRKARTELRAIGKYYEGTSGKLIAEQNVRKIASQVLYLFENPIIGAPIFGLSIEYRFWYALGKKYKIYFRRSDDNSIKVLRIRGSRQKPLDPKNISE